MFLMSKFRLSPSSIILSAFLIVFYFYGYSKAVDKLALDLNFNLRRMLDEFTNQKRDARDIVIVGIDEKFVSEYSYRIGDLDRLFYAKAISNLNTAGVKVIAVDMFFPEKENKGSDLALADAIKSAKVVLPQIRQSIKSTDSGVVETDFVPFNPLLQFAKRGIISLDEAARYMHPIVYYAGKEYSSFALATLELAGLAKHKFSRKRRLIDYIGPEKSFPYYSFLDIYRNNFSYTKLKDKIVLLGVTLKGTDRDQIISPFGSISGLEVEANQVYTLYKSRLREISQIPYLLLLLLSAFFWPQISRRKMGHRYLIIGVLSILTLSFISFINGLYVPVLSLVLIPIFSYIATSYKLLKNLDKELSQKISKVLDHAFFAESSDDITKNLGRGFAPIAYMDDARDMLESLVISLDADEGVLIFESSISKTKKQVNPALIDYANKAFAEGRDASTHSKPIFVARVFKEDEKPIGVLALSLNRPLQPELSVLLKTSIEAFRQMASYQGLRDRTLTFANTLWPWREQSSLDKINALAMLGDLLATERSWLGTLLETLPQAVFIMSPYGYSIYKNAAARKLFGESKNMLRAIPEHLSIEEKRFQNSYLNMVERGDELEFGLTDRKTEHPLLINMKVVRDSGHTRGVAAIISNLNIVEEMDRKRQEMVAMIAHDLRSPLTSIQGFTQMLLANGSVESEYLKIIEDEAGRMKRMTDVFLDLDRLESDSFLLEPKRINLAEILRYSVAVLSSQAVQKSILISVSAPTHLDIVADGDLLSRMLVNILSNAIKYSADNTEIKMLLRAEKNEAIIDVIDQGYGMSQKQLADLFHKFKRSDEHNVSGTGLGLYVVKLIVEAHGGTIEVESSKSKGSHFKIRFPYDISE